MNLSGESVEKYVKYYRIPLENVMVIYDDMDTEVGAIRVRQKGGAGSHNGMKSMVKELKTEDFSRIRVGVGKPKNEFDRINYVIGHVNETEYNELEKGQEKAVEATIAYIKNGIDYAMNQFNEKQSKNRE